MQKSTVKQVQGSNLQLLFVKKFKAANLEKPSPRSPRLNSEAYVISFTKKSLFAGFQELNKIADQLFQRSRYLSSSCLWKNSQRSNFKMQTSASVTCVQGSKMLNSVCSNNYRIIADHLFKEAFHLSRSSKN